MHDVRGRSRASCWHPPSRTCSARLRRPATSSTRSTTSSKRTDDDDFELDLTAEAPLTTDSLQQFLNEAGRYPLLTAAEEVELAKRIERGDWLPRSG